MTHYLRLCNGDTTNPPISICEDASTAFKFIKTYLQEKEEDSEEEEEEEVVVEKVNAKEGEEEQKEKKRNMRIIQKEFEFDNTEDERDYYSYESYREDNDEALGMTYQKRKYIASSSSSSSSLATASFLSLTAQINNPRKKKKTSRSPSSSSFFAKSHILLCCFHHGETCVWEATHSTKRFSFSAFSQLSRNDLVFVRYVVDACILDAGVSIIRGSGLHDPWNSCVRVDYVEQILNCLLASDQIMDKFTDMVYERLEALPKETSVCLLSSQKTKKMNFNFIKSAVVYLSTKPRGKQWLGNKKNRRAKSPDLYLHSQQDPVVALKSWFHLPFESYDRLHLDVMYTHFLTSPKEKHVLFQEDILSSPPPSPTPKRKEKKRRTKKKKKKMPMSDEEEEEEEEEKKNEEEEEEQVTHKPKWKNNKKRKQLSAHNDDDDDKVEVKKTKRTKIVDATSSSSSSSSLLASPTTTTTATIGPITAGNEDGDNADGGGGAQHDNAFTIQKKKSGSGGNGSGEKEEQEEDRPRAVREFIDNCSRFAECGGSATYQSPTFKHLHTPREDTSDIDIFVFSGGIVDGDEEEEYFLNGGIEDTEETAQIFHEETRKDELRRTIWSFLQLLQTHGYTIYGNWGAFFSPSFPSSSFSQQQQQQQHHHNHSKNKKMGVLTALPPPSSPPSSIFSKQEGWRQIQLIVHTQHYSLLGILNRFDLSQSQVAVYGGGRVYYTFKALVAWLTKKEDETFWRFLSPNRVEKALKRGYRWSDSYPELLKIMAQKSYKERVKPRHQAFHCIMDVNEQQAEMSIVTPKKPDPRQSIRLRNGLVELQEEVWRSVDFIIDKKHIATTREDMEESYTMRDYFEIDSDFPNWEHFFLGHPFPTLLRYKFQLPKCCLENNAGGADGERGGGGKDIAIQTFNDNEKEQEVKEYRKINICLLEGIPIWAKRIKQLTIALFEEKKKEEDKDDDDDGDDLSSSSSSYHIQDCYVTNSTRYWNHKNQLLCNPQLVFDHEVVMCWVVPKVYCEVIGEEEANEEWGEGKGKKGIVSSKLTFQITDVQFCE